MIFKLAPVSLFLVILIVFSLNHCNKSQELNETNSSVLLLLNNSSQIISAVSTTSSNAYETTIKCFLFILVLLGLVVLLILNNFVLLVFKHLKCFKNDSLCLFFNRELSKEEKKKDKKRIYTIETHDEDAERENSENSFQLPLLENSNQNDISYYGVKHDESEEFGNYNMRNPNVENYFRNWDDNFQPLNSFRGDSSAQVDAKYEEYMGIYNEFSNVPATNRVHDLLNDPLNELDKIEKHLSKSLSELNELHRKLCSERNLSFENSNDEQIRELDDDEKDQDNISVDELTATLINKIDSNYLPPSTSFINNPNDEEENNNIF